MIGYLASTLMGLTLGLLGAGGSILTVPILVYLLGYSAQTATGYSLFIVGFVSMIGAFRYYLAKQLQLKVAILFAIPTLIGVYSARRWILPSLPDPILSMGSWTMGKDIFLLLAFACLMVMASFKMVRPKKQNQEQTNANQVNPVWITLRGLVIGIIIGLIGAGGGFLIIPALVLIEKMDMKVAVGTSLTIITLNSLFGFLGEWQVVEEIEWTFLWSFIGFAVIGLWAGTLLSKKIDSAHLKKIFGYFVLLMGIGILTKEMSTLFL